MFTTYIAYMSSSLVGFPCQFSDTLYPEEFLSTLAHLK
jgi:hypothetical protein